jgi:uncharacterized membrane protein
LLESLHPNYIALISAFFTATAQTLLGKSIGRLSPGVASLIANIVITFIATVFYLAGGGVDEWPLYAVTLFAISGIIANFAARYLMYMAIQLIGLSRTQVLFQFSPLWSSLVAITFLGEHLTLGVGGGTVLIIGGATLIMGERNKGDSKTKFIYYLLPVFAGLVMAAAPSIRKHAFTMIPSATFGLAIACFVASFLQAALLPITERKTEMKVALRPVLIALRCSLVRKLNDHRLLVGVLALEHIGHLAAKNELAAVGHDRGLGPLAIGLHFFRVVYRYMDNHECAHYHLLLGGNKSFRRRRASAPGSPPIILRQGVIIRNRV